MTRIAHLSDLHLLEASHHRRRGTEKFRLSYLSFGRRLDARDRRRRVLAALDSLRDAGVDHLFLTGDLTEDGTPAQFEVLAEVLDEAGVDPDAVTMVPGNHDAYDDPRAFERALDGPLAAYRRTSAPGSVTVFGDLVTITLSTVLPQPFTRSAGRIEEEALEVLDRVAHDPVVRDRALVVAQHHPPHPHAVPAYNWIDGLQNHRATRAVMGRHDHLHVLHGHTHKASDRTMQGAEETRVFCTTACVESESPIRLYDVVDGRLRPVERTGTTAPTPVVARTPRRRAPTGLAAAAG